MCNPSVSADRSELPAHQHAFTVSLPRLSFPQIAALCHGKPLGERALRALARWECLKQALAFDRWLEWCHERELARAHTTRALESRYRRLLTSAVAGFRLAVERGRRRRWGEGMRERNAKSEGAAATLYWTGQIGALTKKHIISALAETSQQTVR